MLSREELQRRRRIAMPPAIKLSPGDMVIVGLDAGGRMTIHPVHSAGLRVIADEQLKWMRAKAKRASEDDPADAIPVRYALYRVTQGSTLEKIK